ncbi:MAG: HEAT repeat domain-containing protein [Candidatus Rokubacteria bacterium]|nr:HEAT repeat domain-containing protein [Candidatus Rokubacteria bacterium]
MRDLRWVVGCLVLTASIPSLDGDATRSAFAERVPAPTIHVAVRQGLLTVNVRDRRLADVLRVIGAQAGVRVVLLGDLDTSVTQSFNDVPLDEGIQRLVRGYSLALIYGAARDPAGANVLTEVWVIGSSPVEKVQMNTDAAEDASPKEALPTPARRRDTPTTADLIRTLSQDRDPRVQARAAKALARIGGPEAAAALRAALADQEASVRIEAARALGKVEGADAVQALRGVLSADSDPRVRQAVVQALAALPGEEVEKVLEAAVRSDRDGSVRQEATRALARRQKRNR